MGSLQIFEHDQFGKIRTVTIDGEPWLVGKDVAAALGYSDSGHAILDHVDDTDRCNSKTRGRNDPEFGQRGTWLINESGVYSLAFTSKLPEAKRFKHWVTSEVLPSIRKHGGYLAGQEAMTDTELLAKAVLVATSQLEERAKRIAELEQRIDLDAPKVAFAEDVAQSQTAITMQNFAQSVYPLTHMGRNNLYKLLRSMSILQDNNAPYQQYLQAGYFERAEVMKNGQIYPTTFVTGKGQLYLHKRLSEHFGLREVQIAQ